MAGDDWASERREVTYTAARAVLDAQNDTMADIDAKAMRTVRFNVLLIGVLLTAARFAGSEAFEDSTVHVAVAALVLSTVLGIATYSESNLYVGPTGTYLERLASGDPPGGDWDVALVETVAGMISENAEALDWNSWLLTATQTCLVVGILAGVAATVL